MQCGIEILLQLSRHLCISSNSEKSFTFCLSQNS